MLVLYIEMTYICTVEMTKGVATTKHSKSEYERTNMIIH